MTKTKLLCTGLAVAVGCGVLVMTIAGAVRHHAKTAPSAAGDAPAEAGRPGAAIRVKTVHPKISPNGFARTVTQPAYVKPFYQADLMSHVAGPVKYIEKNIGDEVKEGEVLVELDVPELVQDVFQKGALVKQAEQDVRAAEAFVPIAQAAEKGARAAIQEKEAEVLKALATMRYRQSEYQRFKMLASGQSPAVTPAVVEERQRDFEAAEANWKAAQVAVEQARASAEEFASKLAAARVDVDVKQSRVAVAQADRARVQALLDYAKVRAPFNGMIVDRRVDPGTFVQNASTGQPTSILTVVRTDVVTAVVWVPEKDAPYVTKDTEVVLHFDALGGQTLRGKVTRLSHLLDPNKSRDMRVEVDLNNAATPHNRPAAPLTVAAGLAPLAANGPPQDVALLAAGRQTSVGAGLLTPGMYGTMKLVLQKFDGAHLLPEGAVFERGGRTCVFEVNDGKAHLQPVKVQVDDGTRVKVVKLVRQGGAGVGQGEEVAQELTGKEEVIQSDQGEIADGQRVQTTAGEW